MNRPARLFKLSRSAAVICAGWLLVSSCTVVTVYPLKKNSLTDNYFAGRWDVYSSAEKKKFTVTIKIKGDHFTVQKDGNAEILPVYLIAVKDRLFASLVSDSEYWFIGQVTKEGRRQFKAVELDQAWAVDLIRQKKLKGKLRKPGSSGKMMAVIENRPGEVEALLGSLSDQTLVKKPETTIRFERID